MRIDVNLNFQKQVLMNRKQASKAIRTSRRRPCPIDINCELVTERGKTCPNRDYCKRVAAPWDFPYRLGTLADGTRVLIVSYFFLSDHKTYYHEAGWFTSQELPYFYAEAEDNTFMLVVAIDPIHHSATEMRKIGWQNAEDLTNNFYLSYWFYRVEVPNCSYPRCILPPNY